MSTTIYSRDLSTLPPATSKQFIDYFNAALLSSSDLPLPPSGTAGFTDLGYEARIDYHLQSEQNGVLLIVWKILQRPDGSAISIEAVSEAETAAESWTALAYQFVEEVLVSILSEQKQIFFRRNYFAVMHGQNLDGEYWLPGFRFAPQFPDDDSRLWNSERYLVIDQNIEAIDSAHANRLASERAALASSHLSLLTDVGLYRPVQQHRWFLKRGDTGLIQERESTQHIDLALPPEMPTKGQYCEQVRFTGSVFQHEKTVSEPFACPEESRRILRGLASATPEKKAAFDKCALLYQLALTIGRHHPTVKTSYEYASVDAIVSALGSHNGSVSEFIRAYVPEDNDAFLDYLHGRVRSAHFHTGDFALGETDHRMDFLTNPESLIRHHLIRQAHKLIRTAIFNWVMDEIATTEDS